MTENVDLKAKIEIEDSGDAGIRKITDSLGALSERAQSLVSEVKSLARGLEGAEKSLAGVDGKARAASRGISTIAAQTEKAASALKSFDMNGKTVEFEPFYGGKSFKNTTDELIRRGRTIEQLKAQYADLAKVIKLSTDASKNAGDLSGIGRSNRNWATDSTNLANNPISAKDFTSKAAAEAAGYYEQAAAATQKFGNSLRTNFNSIEVFNDGLANTRYALHDVSNSLGIAGVAMIAVSGMFIKASADYESAMADIQRTAELTNVQTAEMRKQFIGIAQEIPAAFKDIAQVGELAGQLNVPSDRIAAFSESVLKFSATTNVTAEAAATAFGRLDALLPDIQGNYDALGSSILKVGINSVATESEIISTTSQIAAAGAAAGLSADQVIGLSASFASLGVAPEAARGTVIRVFGLMNAAVAEGGAKLESFAAQAGVSAEQFRASWGTAAFTDTFLGFLQGIQTEGSRAQLALKDLGIWAARDQNNLLKLSQNSGLVVDTFAEAAQGMADASILSDNFAIKAETLNSKLQLLANNAQAFAATLGEANNGPVKSFVDTLNKLLKTATDLAANPVVQWAATVAGSFIMLSGVTMLATSGFARAGASMLAMRPVASLLSQAGEIMANRWTIANRAVAAFGDTTTAAGSKAMAATVMFRGLAGIMRTIGSGIAIGAAVSLAFAGIEKVVQALKSNVDKATDAFGDLKSLTEASASDAQEAIKQYGSAAKAVEQSGGAFQVLDVTVNGSNQRLREAADNAALVEQSQGNLGGAVQNTTQDYLDQEVVIGRLARGKMLELLQSQDGMSQSMLRLKAVGFPLEEYLQKLMTDMPGAMALQQEWADKLKNTSVVLLDAEHAASGAGITYTQVADAVGQLKTAQDLVSGSIEQVGLQQAWASAEGRAFGETAATTAGDLDILSDASDYAGDSMADLAAEISAAFSEINNTANLSDSISEIIRLAAVGELAGEYMTGGILENVGTIEKAIEASIIAGQAQGYSATESVSAMFDALAQKGVDVANLLNSLSGMGLKQVAGVHLGDVYKGLGKSTSGLSSVFAGLDKQLDTTSGRMGSAGKAADKLKDKQDKLKDAVRTLKDYAGDLSSVWERAFEIRFGSTQAMDSIVKGFNDLREAALESQQAIRSLQTDIMGIQATISKQQFALSVAVMYGDDKSALALNANLAKSRDDLAKKTAEMAKEEAKHNKTLTGTTSTAIDNRKEVMNTVAGYQSYIKSLAASGMSQQQLAAETARLKQEFISQYSQLGYNSGELAVYAAAFDDVTLSIQRVPRNVTVSANTNPAIQSFNEFQAKANASMKTVNDSINNLRNNAGRGVNMPAIINSNNARELRRMAMEAEMVVHSRNAAALSAAGGAANMQGARLSAYAAADLRARLQAGNFWSGGYTGRGGMKDYAGDVHRGEYVFKKSEVNQSTGTPKPEAMMKFMPSTARASANAGGAGGVAGTVGLNAATIAALIAGMPQALIVNDRVLGEATSQAYSDSNDIGKY